MMGVEPFGTGVMSMSRPSGPVSVKLWKLLLSTTVNQKDRIHETVLAKIAEVTADESAVVQ